MGGQARHTHGGHGLRPYLVGVLAQRGRQRGWQPPPDVVEEAAAAMLIVLGPASVQGERVTGAGRW